MKVLSQEAWDRAVGYIKSEARQLERKLFNWRFEGGDARDALDELLAYQNDDGGFGAVESDISSSMSTVLNCTHALRIATDLEIPKDHVAIENTLRYLSDSYDPALKAWPIIPRHDNSFPHAPWWHCDENFEKGWNYFRDNPRPEVLGYLYTYGSDAQQDMMREVEAAVAERAAEIGDEGVPRDSITCYISLALCAATPEHLRDLLLPKVKSWIDAGLERNPEKWTGYCLKPLDAVHSPDSPFHPGLEDAISANIDWEIDNQAADGSWEPNWD